MTSRRTVDTESIRRELAGIAAPVSRLASYVTPPGWLLTRDVARLWGMPIDRVYGLPGRVCIERRSARGTKSFQNSGALWLEAEVRRVAEIRKRCRISLANSLKVFAAIKQGGAL